MYAELISYDVDSQFWPCCFLSCVDIREDRGQTWVWRADWTICWNYFTLITSAVVDMNELTPTISVVHFSSFRWSGTFLWFHCRVGDGKHTQQQQMIQNNLAYTPTMKSLHTGSSGPSPITIEMVKWIKSTVLPVKAHFHLAHPATM